MSAAHALRQILGQLGISPERAEEVDFENADPVLATRLRVGEAAAAAIGAVGLLACDLWKLRGGGDQKIGVDVRAAAASLLSFAYQRVAGPELPPIDARVRLTDFYRTRDDSWLLLHNSFPRTTDATLELLECGAEKDSVATAIAKWDAAELEDVMAERGLCGARVRSAGEWRLHHGKLVGAGHPGRARAAGERGRELPRPGIALPDRHVDRLAGAQRRTRGRHRSRGASRAAERVPDALRNRHASRARAAAVRDAAALGTPQRPARDPRGMLALRLSQLVYSALGALTLLSACAHPALLDDPAPPDETHILPGLKARVVVFRDEHAIPYIVAESLEDALRAQGYVTAHDRLYQLEFLKTLSKGQLSEWIGERGLTSDRLVRTVGIPQLGRRQALLLSEDERRFYLAYLEGVNAYIENRPRDHAPGLAKLGISAKPWSLEEVLALQFFQIWSSSVNWRQELLTQQIIDKLGGDKAREISQLTINPDDESDSESRHGQRSEGLGLWISAELMDALPRASAIGSNAWAVDSEHSESGGALLASDPHLEAITLPGFWHPAAIVTRELRAVGGATPGSPGFGIARTEHIAYGATNGYADVVDLFIESEDPQRAGHYLEGDRSLRFETREETIRVRDRNAATGFRSERLAVRSTRRGPIISDHGMELSSGKLLSLRWSVPERLGSEMGARGLLTARSLKQARGAIGKIAVPLNHVVVDHRGNIARISSGGVPIRTRGDGSAPTAVRDEEDAWAGFIPQDAMPRVENPAAGWVGAANHRVLPGDYPYAYSTYFSHSWRYRRLLELFDGLTTTNAEEQWRFQRDEKNVLAERVVPMLLPALRADESTRGTAETLANWDFFDSSDAQAPLLFQALYRHFAHRTFRDELGGELSGHLLESWYYWHERLERMLSDPHNAWFDDIRTPQVESRDDLFRLAAGDAQDELRAKLGDDPSRWQWGRLHSVEFASPVRAAQAGGGCPGGGKHAIGGSGETLARALYRFARPYDARVIASMRFVADFGDPDKVTAVIPGGVSGRCGDPHGRDQLDAWLTGEPVHWWFSDDAIRTHAVSKELLLPTP